MDVGDAANISVLYLARVVRKDGGAAGQGVKSGGASWAKMSVSSLLCVERGGEDVPDSCEGVGDGSRVGVLGGESDGVASQVLGGGGWMRGSGAFALFLIQASGTSDR